MLFFLPCINMLARLDYLWFLKKIIPSYHRHLHFFFLPESSETGKQPVLPSSSWVYICLTSTAAKVLLFKNTNSLKWHRPMELKLSNDCFGKFCHCLQGFWFIFGEIVKVLFFEDKFTSISKYEAEGVKKGFLIAFNHISLSYLAFKI